MEYLDFLRKYYDSLYTTLLSNKQFTKNEKSIFLKYIIFVKNNAEKFLNESAIKDLKIPSEIIITLKKKNLIRESSTEPNKSHITAYGVWELEKNLLVDNQLLVGYFDEKKFTFAAKTRKVKENEKLRLFTMLATRAFSNNSPLRLQTESEKKNWKIKCDNCYDFLKKINVISKPKEGKGGIYGGAKSESPIVNLFRHSEEMRNLTKGIWYSDTKTKSPSGGVGLTYYLDLAEGDGLDKNKLISIIKIIFEGHLNAENEFEIKEFCHDMAFDTVGLFDSNHVFSRPKYEDDIEYAFFEARLDLTN